MLVLGITGGVGAGKSTVLNYMEETYGARIIQADLAAHMLMKKGTDCYQRILDTFGEHLVDSTGELDRKRLGEVVFANPEELEKLNNIVHPAVKAYICEEISKEREKGTCSLLALEAALLIEEGYDAVCDELWYIYASEEVRRERLIKTRGYSDERITGIFKSQCQEEEFMAHCAVKIDTGISLECTKEQVRDFLKERNIY